MENSKNYTVKVQDLFGVWLPTHGTFTLDAARSQARYIRTEHLGATRRVYPMGGTHGCIKGVCVFPVNN